MAVLIAVLLCGPAAPFAGAEAPAASRGIGPFTLVAKRGTVSVRLLRRDKDLIWVLQRSSAGTDIETGVNVKDITRFEVGRPRLFDAAESVTRPDQVEQIRSRMEAYVRQLAPYRDLPGMNVDEAQLLLGGLLEKTGDWARAAAAYSEILAQAHRPPAASEAGLRLGICLARQQKYEEAQAYLDTTGLPEENLDLVSDVYLARGETMAALGRHDDAIMSYLHLVVFHPFVHGNEPRCLAAVLPEYAAIGDWESAYQAATWLRRHGDDTQVAAAEQFMEAHRDKMEAEKAFRGDTLDETETDNAEGADHEAE